MRKLFQNTTKVLAIPVLILMLVTACVGTSPKENFYTLSSQKYDLKQADEKLQSFKDTFPNVYINIAAVTITEVVDRPQLVIKIAPNQVQILEQQRWAQPLKNEISRIVAKNLSTLLNTNHVTNYPSNSINTKLAPNLIIYKVLLNVQQFESNLGSNATVTVSFTVHKMVKNQFSGDTITNTQQITGKNYSDLVEAHSRALGVISYEIAKAIVNMSS